MKIRAGGKREHTLSIPSASSRGTPSPTATSASRGSSCSKGIAYVKYVVSHLSVEVVIFLFYFGWIFGNTIQAHNLYRKICQMYFYSVPNVNCYNIDKKEIENVVQRHTAEWSLYNSMCYLIPAMFADTILGAFGDRYGRQLCILLSLAGILCSEYVYALALADWSAWPFWTTTIAGVFAGMTGYYALLSISCYAYLADTTPDSDLLTIRTGIFSASQATAAVLGGSVAALCKDLGVAWAIDIEMLFIFFAIIYTIVRIPQKQGLSSTDRLRPSGTCLSLVSQPSTTTADNKTPVVSFFSEIVTLLKEGLRTYFRKRVGHRQAFIFITVISLLITYTTNIETRESLIVYSYVFRRTGDNTLDWDAEDLGYWKATSYAFWICGTLFGLYLFKKVFKLRETTLIIIGLISSGLRTTLMGFATDDWIMYVANALGCFAGIVPPAAVSYIAQIVPSEEVGKTYALFGIAGDITFILANVIYAGIYRETISWIPGFLFIAISAIQFIAAAAMVWVHFRSIEDGVYAPKSEIIVGALRAAVTLPIQSARGYIPRRKGNSGIGLPSIYEHVLERQRQRHPGAPSWGNEADIREQVENCY